MMTTKIKPHAIKWYGCRRDTLDARDLFFKPRGRRQLPKAVDLRPSCPPVMDQGNLGSCTAHGITGALRHAMISRVQPDFAMARLQLYYDERAAEGTVSEDAGAEIRDGIKCAAKIGVAHEKLWPYTISRFARKPTAAVYKDAVKFLALTYERVTVNKDSLKAALALGYPVVVGFSVYESFESAEVERTGVVPLPNIKKEQMLGGHCTYLVGYGQKAGTFTMRNSWGTSWGDKGDCYVPEAYIGSPSFGSDYWIIKSEGAA